MAKYFPSKGTISAILLCALPATVPRNFNADIERDQFLVRKAGPTSNSGRDVWGMGACTFSEREVLELGLATTASQLPSLYYLR